MLGEEKVVGICTEREERMKCIYTDGIRRIGKNEKREREADGFYNYIQGKIDRDQKKDKQRDEKRKKNGKWNALSSLEDEKSSQRTLGVDSMAAMSSIG